MLIKIKSLWVENIKQLVCSLGYSGIWYSQKFPNSKWLVKAVNAIISQYSNTINLILVENN